MDSAKDFSRAEISEFRTNLIEAEGQAIRKDNIANLQKILKKNRITGNQLGKALSLIARVFMSSEMSFTEFLDASDAVVKSNDYQLLIEGMWEDLVFYSRPDRIVDTWTTDIDFAE